jgi:hypothetical protein
MSNVFILTYSSRGGVKFMKLFKVYVKVWEPLCCVDANCVPFCQCLICGGESQVGFSSVAVLLVSIIQNLDKQAT